MSQKIDDRIVKTINVFVSLGVRNVREMERHVHNFVINELFKGEETPARTSRRFFPKKAVIRSHMNRIAANNRLAKMDQENLSKKIMLWKTQNKNDRFFFRGYEQVKEEIINEEENEENDSEEITVSKT